MAEWETIQDRNISGKGVLKLPIDVVKNRAYILFATVIREPINKYANFGWNPYRSRFANLVFLRAGYVLNSVPMEFEKQVYDGINDICGQDLIAVKCMYAGVLQTFKNLAVALSQTPGSVGLYVADSENKIKDFESLRFQWDEVRVQCYADTGINLRLDSLIYDVCDEEAPKDRPPPPPPPPKPKTPPGQPLPNSPPYNPGTGDDQNSIPYPGDEPEDPTEGMPCVPYQVSWSYDASFNDYPPGTVNRSITVWGKIGGIRSQVNASSTTDFYLKCQGVKSGDEVSTTAVCLTFKDYFIGGNGQTYPTITVTNVRINSVTQTT